MTRTLLPAAAAMLLPFAAHANELAHAHPPAGGPSSCAAPVTPDGPLAAWTKPVPLAAGADRDRAVPLSVGQAARVTLLPTPRIDYPVQPEKPGAPTSHGGLIAITVPQAGIYRVALGSGAWIDLVREGKAVASTAHGHGPDCTGVRKIVDFPLLPGRYTLQLAASGTPQITVLVARLP